MFASSQHCVELNLNYTGREGRYGKNTRVDGLARPAGKYRISVWTNYRVNKLPAVESSVTRFN